MILKKTNLLIFIISVYTLGAFSQNKAIESFYINAPLDSISAKLDKESSVETYLYVFDIAKQMSLYKIDSLQTKKGYNLMALLAKKVTNLANAKAINLDEEDFKSILLKFEEEKYFIQLPKISRFIKTMNYFCKGEYVYVHEKLVNNMYYKVFLLIFSLSLLLFLACLSHAFKWTYKKKYKILYVYALVAVLIVFIAFKLTCETGIKDYTFYGFTV